MPDAIGWVSSLILLLTIGKQIHKQWHDASSRGVSVWLFVGQSAASLGFTVYSVLVENWVFVVTNALMLLAGIVGFVITAHHQRRASAAPPSSAFARRA
jgi:MtN3 and saliva related transmembrane protein